jgi:hypothetical protein
MENSINCDTLKSIFISYCQNDSHIVHRIVAELENQNYKIWIDRDILKGNYLFEDIQKGIKYSHLILCFISEKYCLSKNCLIEISYAFKQNKKILPIMLDDYFKNEEKGIGLIISPITCFYAFKEPNTFSTWSFSHYKSLENTISRILFELCKTCFNEIKRNSTIVI